MGVDSDYYISKKTELLKDFKELTVQIRDDLAALYGDEFADDAVLEMNEEFEKFIPEIPYIGGDENILTTNLLSCARYLIIYRVLKRKGKDLKEIGELCYNLEDELFKNRPDVIPQICHPKAIKYFEYAAPISGKYPEDFKYRYVEGEDFDLGLDFTECALLKLFKKHGAEEFMPYICAMDIPISKYGNLGLHRTKTLAEGFDVCDFRYKVGRKTRVKLR